MRLAVFEQPIDRLAQRVLRFLDGLVLGFSAGDAAGKNRETMRRTLPSDRAPARPDKAVFSFGLFVTLC
jgi:hypothetical protein